MVVAGDSLGVDFAVQPGSRFFDFASCFGGGVGRGASDVGAEDLDGVREVVGDVDLIGYGIVGDAQAAFVGIGNPDEIASKTIDKHAGRFEL